MDIGFNPCKVPKFPKCEMAQVDLQEGHSIFMKVIWILSPSVAAIHKSQLSISQATVQPACSSPDMRQKATAGKEDTSYQPSGLWPKTTWEAELGLGQGLCPSQQLTYSSWSRNTMFLSFPSGEQPRNDPVSLPDWRGSFWRWTTFPVCSLW